MGRSIFQLNCNVLKFKSAEFEAGE